MLSAYSCRAIAKKYRQQLIDAFFNIVMTEDYICGYVVPLCEPAKYDKLNEEDYIQRILSSKPFIA